MLALVPGDEDRAARLVLRRGEDARNPQGHPVVTVADPVAAAPPSAVHVVAQVGRDEVVTRCGTRLQVLLELGQRPDVSGAKPGVACDVLEKDERIVLRRVQPMARDRTFVGRNAFLVSLPGNAGLAQLRDEMVAVQMVRGRVLVVADAEIGSSFEPEVVRLARVHARRVEISLGVRAHAQERAVQVRSMCAGVHLRPVRVLHQDDEDRLEVRREQKAKDRQQGRR